jgi:hypothetical protein
MEKPGKREDSRDRELQEMFPVRHALRDLLHLRASHNREVQRVQKSSKEFKKRVQEENSREFEREAIGYLLQGNIV